MKLELLEYFSIAYMTPGTELEEIEEIYKQFRRLTFDERQAFKQEILYVEQLLQTNNNAEITRICETYLSDSLLTVPLNLAKFISLILPIIEKYEYNPKRKYIELSALEYVLHTYLLPNTLWIQFIYEDIQREDDTFIAHLKKDIALVEQAFTKQDAILLEKITKLSDSAGMYILLTNERDEFIENLNVIS